MAKKAVKPRKTAAKSSKPKQLKDLKAKNISGVKGGRVKGGAVPYVG